jgi:hypothetical protein
MPKALWDLLLTPLIGSIDITLGKANTIKPMANKLPNVLFIDKKGNNTVIKHIINNDLECKTLVI